MKIYSLTGVKILDMHENKNNAVKNQRAIWDRYIINYLITVLKKFILCKYKTVNFQLHESMNNPYIY